MRVNVSLTKVVWSKIHILLFGSPTAKFEPLSRRHLTNPILITCVYVNYQPEAHQETLNKIGLLRLTKRLVGIESGFFWFFHNTLTHQATLPTFPQTSLLPQHDANVYFKCILAIKSIKKIIKSCSNLPLCI